MNDRPHIHKAFDDDLAAVRAKLLEMAGEVRAQIVGMNAVLHDEDAKEKVFSAGRRVNQEEKTIDHLCFTVIARRQPAAGDLRLLVATLKTITELERIGDEAERATRCYSAPAARQLLTGSEHGILRDCGDDLLDMFDSAMSAYDDEDVNTAIDVVRRDSDINDVFRRVFTTIIRQMQSGGGDSTLAVNLVFAAKAIERMGDHIKNIGEHVIFVATGDDVRHGGLDAVTDKSD